VHQGGLALSAQAVKSCGLSSQGQGQDRPVEPSAGPAGDAHAAECRSCGVATAYAVNSAAGAGACAPEVQVLDGGFGSAETWCWPKYQLLIQLRGAAVDGAGMQVRIAAFQVRGALDDLSDDALGEPGRMFLEHAIDCDRELVG